MKLGRTLRGGKIRSEDVKELLTLYHNLSAFIAAAERVDSLDNYECPMVLDTFLVRFDCILMSRWRPMYRNWLELNGMSKKRGRVKGLKCLREFLIRQVEEAQICPSAG